MSSFPSFSLSLAPSRSLVYHRFADRRVIHPHAEKSVAPGAYLSNRWEKEQRLIRWRSHLLHTRSLLRSLSSFSSSSSPPSFAFLPWHTINSRDVDDTQTHTQWHKAFTNGRLQLRRFEHKCFASVIQKSFSRLRRRDIPKWFGARSRTFRITFVLYIWKFYTLRSESFESPLKKKKTNFSINLVIWIFRNRGREMLRISARKTIDHL